MNFPSPRVTIDPLFLVIIGFTVGVLGGFLFGVGGSFLVKSPALYSLGLPMAIAVGTDLAHILGKSIVAAKRHRTLGNIDFKLGLLMVVATMIGVEGGVRSIQRLKHTHYLDLVVGGAFVCILVLISGFMLWDSIQTLRMKKAALKRSPGNAAKTDASAFGYMAKAIQRFPMPPYVSLPISNIPRISVWPIFAVAVCGGFFSGFFGGGAGYIRMPALIYLLGVPTHIAVGTDLFEIIISASYGNLQSCFAWQCGHPHRPGHVDGRRAGRENWSPSHPVHQGTGPAPGFHSPAPHGGRGARKAPLAAAPGGLETPWSLTGAMILSLDWKPLLCMILPRGLT